MYLQAMKTVYRLGGLGGYFRGVQARIMYQMPSTAICWSTYEFFKYILGASPAEVRLLPTGSVHAEEEKPTEGPVKTDVVSDVRNIKPIELPAMSGAGLYGSLSYNTMHKTDTNFKNRRKDSVLDIIHS